MQRQHQQLSEQVVPVERRLPTGGLDGNCDVAEGWEVALTPFIPLSRKPGEQGQAPVETIIRVKFWGSSTPLLTKFRYALLDAAWSLRCRCRTPDNGKHQKGGYAMRRALATLTLCASTATAALATVLTFDNANVGLFNSIPTNYGSRVNASGTDESGSINFDLTLGATPNIAVQMYTASYGDNTWNQLYALFRWASGYANLTSVAYHGSGEGARIVLTADAGYQVRLHQFQMGGYLANQTLPFLQVLVDGNPVYTQSNIPISGTTANTFTFDPDVVKGRVIEIRWADNTGACVGIDNIAFSQTGGCEPNPADVNNDGVVDDADLLLVLFNFGWRCGD